MKTQHQNPEFGHTQGEIRKKNILRRGGETQKTINFVWGWGVKIEFHPVFRFS